MKLTDINTNNIKNEIIKKVLFSIPKNKYSEADCLIVFGCHLKPLLEERIKLTVDILRSKKIEKILLTGGIGVAGDFNEAEYMKEVLLKHGIKKENILIEDKSTTTEENIINSIEILKNNNLIENKKLILVSNQAHLRRIGMEFKKQLNNTKYVVIYEYPSTSLISFENILKNNELRALAINEIKKIISFIDIGIIDNENI